MKLPRPRSLSSRPHLPPAQRCPKTVAQLEQLKSTLSKYVRRRSAVPENMLHLALREAEALAWQTAYPDLVFPTLAMEKAEATMRWQARQESIKAAKPTPKPEAVEVAFFE